MAKYGSLSERSVITVIAAMLPLTMTLRLVVSILTEEALACESSPRYAPAAVSVPEGSLSMMSRYRA